MPNLDIVGFIPRSQSDWRGKISSVVFVPGCNFRCSYCFSHQLILNPNSLPKVPVSAVLEHLENKQNGIQAVVVAGGEPTLHGNRLLAFLEEVQSMGLMTRIETNGSNPFMVRTLLENDLLDSIAVDLKAALYPKRYQEFTQKTATVSKIKDSIYLVMNSGIDYEFRTVVVPGKTTLRDVQSICHSIRGAKRYVLQQFVSQAGAVDKNFENIPATSYDELIEMAQRVAGIQEVRIKTERGEETVGNLTQIQKPRA